ncbi:MAG: ATP-binding protein [Bacilli bacterium]|jgi:primosomal protein DnaI|nr:ATP-binding protein [Bacilli bacterium]MDD3388788.1 ATP-binding protein [Bacilli bacterium]MDD4344578.1 ATP-binding protein [Bacilli bacterium]MDD4520472.1 ATP-binding protein [Bacilli bacterium]MDY0399113.1 ATP-binding protein [Bacilli bacterium]
MERINVKKLPKHNLSIDVEQLIKELQADQVIWQALERANIDETTIRHNIVAILDFQQSVQACRSCKGLNTCQSPFQHLELELVNNDGIIERIYRPCRLKVAEENSLKKQTIFDFPADWFSITLGSSGNQVDVNKNRLPFIQAALELLKGNKRWIYLFGKPLMGKSYLAAALANEIFAFNPSVMFVDMNIRIRELSDLQFSNKDAFNASIERFINVDYLILDDFGNEYKNDFVRDTVLLPILNARARNQKVTIFTSDFSIEQIGTMYATNAASKPRAAQMVNLLRALTNGEIELKGIKTY